MSDITEYVYRDDTDPLCEAMPFYHDIVNFGDVSRYPQDAPLTEIKWLGEGGGIGLLLLGFTDKNRVPFVAMPYLDHGKMILNNGKQIDRIPLQTYVENTREFLSLINYSRNGRFDILRIKAVSTPDGISLRLNDTTEFVRWGENKLFMKPVLWKGKAHD